MIGGGLNVTTTMIFQKSKPTSVLMNNLDITSNAIHIYCSDIQQ